MRQMTAPDLAECLRGESIPRPLDVPERWEVEIACIGGSVNVPMADIAPALTEGLLGDSKAELAVICHRGIRSLQVAMRLERVGFSDVADLAGGIDGWSRTVDAKVAAY